MRQQGGGNAEETMIMLLRQNDQQSFFQFYDHYAPLIFGIIKITTGNKENANSLLQRCFEVIWSNRRNFNDAKESMFSWIYRLTLQSLMTTNRNNTFTTVQEEQLALELIVVHGCSFREIADQMNVPVESLKSRIRTALQTYQTSILQ